MTYGKDTFGKVLRHITSNFTESEWLLERTYTTLRSGDISIASSTCRDALPTLIFSRLPWITSQNWVLWVSKRFSELPTWEYHFSHPAFNLSTMYLAFPVFPKRQSNTYNTGLSTIAPIGNIMVPITNQVYCNWHYCECQSAYCRNQHIWITCGCNHKYPQCTQRSTVLTHPAPTGYFTS